MGEQLQRQEVNEQTGKIKLVESIVENKEKMNAEKRKQREYNKRIEQIKSSNTWKVGSLLRSLTSYWKKLFRINADQRTKVAALERTIMTQREEIQRLEAEITPLRLLNEQLNEHSITQQIRSLKDEGKLAEQLKVITQQKNTIQNNYKQALIYAARLYMNEETTTRNAIYETILSSLANEEIPEFMIRAGLAEEPISLRHTSSFRGSLSNRMRQAQLIGMLPEWYLDDKRTAYNFVKQFDINVPILDETIYSIAKMPERDEVVIKPVDAAGARGVYLVHKYDYIFDVRNAKVLNSFKELHDAMQRDLDSGAVEKDEWLIEQLIYENKKQLLPARDIKFYSFYGKVGLILEIVRDPEIRHSWWTRDGKRISTGKYESTLFAGQGVSEAEIEKVEQLSSEIPSPFMRIDFLSSDSGLVFGEFTPKPGNYDEFDEDTDKWLGDYFTQAEGRLINDLIQGKSFTAYEKFVQTIMDKETTEKVNV